MIKAQHSLKSPYCTCLDRDKHYQSRFSQQNTTCFGEMLGENTERNIACSVRRSIFKVPVPQHTLSFVPRCGVCYLSLISQSSEFCSLNSLAKPLLLLPKGVYCFGFQENPRFSNGWLEGTRHLC
jgi:hypothetical protein